jgi:hypothetical protein
LEIISLKLAAAEAERYVARKYICSIGVLKIQFQWQMV